MLKFSKISQNNYSVEYFCTVVRFIDLTHVFSMFPFDLLACQKEQLGRNVLNFLLNLDFSRGSTTFIKFSANFTEYCKTILVTKR